MDWKAFLEFVERGGPSSRQRLVDWDARRRKMTPGWDGYRKGFEAMSHECLFRLRPSDVLDVFRKTEHALAQLRPEHEKFERIESWSPPVPFMYVFHLLLEEMGRVPMWQDAKAFVLSEARLDLVWRPFLKTYGLTPDMPDVSWENPYFKAIMYRIGKVYYSWLREVHMLTELRCTYGIDARYHFLIDAEWKADVFAGDVLLEIFIVHPKYKDKDDKGRKELCRHANPLANVHQVKITPRSVYGRPWLVDASDIKAMARLMKEEGAPLLFEAAV